MRRVTIIAVRSMIVLLLLAAAVDVPLPRRTGDRVRIHLIDRSQSVTLKGPSDSLTVDDAAAIVAHDRDVKDPGDTVSMASFGKTLSWESAAVDSTGTDLRLALTAALGRQPTEIVLYTDGRGDPGDALSLCRQRGVPVHVFPLGPTTLRDVRFRRISAPATVRPGEAYSIDVVVESTYDVDCKVGVGTDVRSVSLNAGVPALLQFPQTKPGPFTARIDAADECPQNNQAHGNVFEERSQPKVLALSQDLRLPGLDLTLAQHPHRLELDDFDAVILDNLPLTEAEQEAIAAYVQNGGGLVLLGGEKSYALGGWLRTPLARLSPLKIHPDLKLAVVLGIDASGSMTNDYDSVVQTLLESRSSFDDDDDILGMTFGDTPKLLELSALRKERPGGGTSISRGIETARLHLETRDAGRKMIVLMTDGEISESPEDILREVRLLKDIGIMVVTTRKAVPGVNNISIHDWDGLRGALTDVSNNIQDVRRSNPGILELRTHPITAGVTPLPLSWINRTTAKTGAQVLGTVGEPPRQDPVLAVQPVGHGRVVAFTIPYDPALSRLFRQALDYAIGERAEGLSLSIDPPLVIAQGTYPEPVFTTDGVSVEMKQVGARRWEGRLPADLSGTVVVRKGRAHAAVTIPCPPELSALGVDRAALERIASETGGRVLRLPSDLESLPRPVQASPRSGRTPFLLAALALVFIELSVSIYWKV